MARTVHQAFNEYKSNLELTDRQVGLVSERHGGVVRAIGAKLSLHPDRGKVIGSWDRRTLTRYLSEGDVDLMVVLHHGDNNAWETSEGTFKCLNRFKAILDDAYPNTSKRRDRNAISMKFSEFSLDVVPAFKHDGGYYNIPDSVRQQWVPTNPFTFAERIAALNAAMGGTFVPLIKMIKGWNREVGWPIRSFHLECLLYGHCRTWTQSYTYSSMVEHFFQSLPNYLGGTTHDPVMGDRVDTYLDNNANPTRRQAAIEKANRAATASKEAYGYEQKYSDYPSYAIGAWKGLLGTFFPNYG